MADVYALVVHDPKGRGYDRVASDTANVLIGRGYDPLYMSNQMHVSEREVADADFETHVFSHGSYCETQDANDEPRDEQSTLEHGTRLATSALVAVRDHVGEVGWRELNRALDAWDEFIQAIEPEVKR